MRSWVIASLLVACGGKAVVDGQPGSGSGGAGTGGGGSGANGAGGMLTSTTTEAVGAGGSTGEVSPIGADVAGSTGSGPSCIETGMRHCNACLNMGGCGSPNGPTGLMVCNGPPSSRDLYTSIYGCVCGTDGKSGTCGKLCNRVCTGMGSDSASCQPCLGMSVTSVCKTQYQSCVSDS